MRVSGLETSLKLWLLVKEDMATTRAVINQLLQTLMSQQAATAQQQASNTLVMLSQCNFSTQNCVLVFIQPRFFAYDFAVAIRKIFTSVYTAPNIFHFLYQMNCSLNAVWISNASDLTPIRKFGALKQLVHSLVVNLLLL